MSHLEILKLEVDDSRKSRQLMLFHFLPSIVLHDKITDDDILGSDKPNGQELKKIRIVYITDLTSR